MQESFVALIEQSATLQAFFEDVVELAAQIETTAEPEKDHENLDNLLGGAANDHHHLTGAQRSTLTGGGDAGSLHHHNSQYYTKLQLDVSLAFKENQGVAQALIDIHEAAADPHPQYHNDVRGDARYYTQTQVDTFLSNKENISNKATDFSTINDTLYPTTKAVNDRFLRDAFESVSKNLREYDYTLSYSGGKLSTMVYALGGGLTITKTFNYTGDKLTSIVLSGNTPSGIDLTKTLSYTGNDLTSVAYS